MLEVTTYDSLSKGLRKQIDSIKAPFKSFATAFASLTEKRIDLAPKFMQTFNRIASEQAITFVQFVRLLDPGVPMGAAGDDGYRVNRSYMAADYLRRLAAQRPRGQRGVRDNATDSLARTLATILQIVLDHDAVWKAVAQEFSLSERMLTGLKRRVDQTQPLFALPVKPVQIAEVIHMPRKEREGAEAPASQHRERAA